MSKKKLKGLDRLYDWYSNYSMFGFLQGSSVYITPRMFVQSNILFFVEVLLISVFLDVFNMVYGLDLGLNNSVSNMMLSLGAFVLFFYVPFKVSDINLQRDARFLQIVDDKPERVMLFSSVYFSKVISRLLSGSFLTTSEGLVFILNRYSLKSLSHSTSTQVMSYLGECLGYNVLVRLNLVVYLGLYFFSLLFKSSSILTLGFPFSELMLYSLYLVLYSNLRLYYVKGINRFYYTFSFLDR